MYFKLNRYSFDKLPCNFINNLISLNDVSSLSIENSLPIFSCPSQYILFIASTLLLLQHVNAPQNFPESSSVKQTKTTQVKNKIILSQKLNFIFSWMPVFNESITSSFFQPFMPSFSYFHVSFFFLGLFFFLLSSVVKVSNVLPKSKSSVLCLTK